MSGLQVFYPSDIRNALLAAEQASGSALVATRAEGDEFARGYRSGYRSALATIALAFGLGPSLGHQGPVPHDLDRQMDFALAVLKGGERP